MLRRTQKQLIQMVAIRHSNELIDPLSTESRYVYNNNACYNAA